MPLPFVRFRRLPAPPHSLWPPRWWGAAAASADDDALGAALIQELVSACRRAGWSAEAQDQWDIRDPRWDPDLRIHLMVRGVSASLYLLPPTAEHPEGEIQIEGIEREELLAEVEAVLRAALSAQPGLALMQVSAEPGS